tara:strand:+ start:6309 stop:6887 length:579 start_codon:yes stop_codon:yes gene_type:complete
MALDPIFLTGTATAVAAVSLLRVSWVRPRRSASLNAAGWLLLAGSLAAGWVLAGAWGVSVMALWAMGAAFAFLAVAAWQSPPARRRASSRRAGMLPEAGEPLRLGHRFATFLLVVLAGMLAAIALAIAARWISLLAGASEANANVLALFVVPLAWTILAFLMLMTDSRKRQGAILALSVAAALPALAAGQLS